MSNPLGSPLGPRPLGDPCGPEPTARRQCRNGLGTAGFVSDAGNGSSFGARRERALAEMRPFGRRAEVLGHPFGGGGHLSVAAGPLWAGGESRDRGLRSFAACSAKLDGIYQRKGALAWPAL